MREVKLTEESVRKAYDGGCDEVKSALDTLFPGLSLRDGGMYNASELDIELCGNHAGCYIVITKPTGATVTSSDRCKE